MKRVNNIYNKITDIDVIMNMYDKVIHRNMKNKNKLEKFDNYYSENIVNIKEILMQKNYIPDNYNIFLISEPKYRIIMGQEIKDKVINHLVTRYFIIPYFDKTFIDSNVATRIGKGTHYGLKLFKKYYNNMSINYDIFYILKFDISKFFYTLDHDIIKNLIQRKIKDKDVLKIIYNIIDSTDEEYVNKKIETLKNNKVNKLLEQGYSTYSPIIKEIRNIPTYKKGKGFPIGNMTSQIFGILYLNEIDHFIKEKIKIKYYIRYMDDGILMHHDKEYLKKCLFQIQRMLEKYHIKFNTNKTKIYCNTEKIEFLGFKFFKKKKIIMKVRNQTKRRFKRKMKKIHILYDNNKLTLQEFKNIESSYIGHLKHGNCKTLMKLTL